LPPSVNVEIFADVVCPWCYLGQARFRKAVAAYGKPVSVTWRPFQLDPDAPAEASPADPHLALMFGGPDKVVAAHARLRSLTSAEGLPYEPEKALRINSAQAHRVIALAGEHGVQDAVAGRLFAAHHAEGRDLSDPAVLAELAAAAGLDVGDLLSGDKGVAELDEQLARARSLGITGVPFFLFEGTWGVSGAQSAEVLENALREVEGRLISPAG
jgi:predicted DsbA family dithiol-disulfide isomerase